MEHVYPEDCPGERLIRIAEVKRLTGLSTTTLYRKIARREFPRPLKITNTARAWKLSEIMAWVDSREREEISPYDDAPDQSCSDPAPTPTK